MFDIGFSELVVIAVVALIVLGPERLPRAARFAGLWVRRARAQWYSVKSEFERELVDEDLKRSMAEASSGLREVETRIRAAGHEVQQQVDDVREQAGSGLSQAQQAHEPPEPAASIQPPVLAEMDNPSSADPREPRP